MLSVIYLATDTIVKLKETGEEDCYNIPADHIKDRSKAGLCWKIVLSNPARDRVEETWPQHRI